MSGFNKSAFGELVARCGCGICIFSLLLLLLMAMCGCKATEVIREVPVITEHTTVQHHTDIVRDTLFQRDSVYHYVMGDTVIIERWHQTVNVNRVVVADTIRDTIPKIVTVTEQVKVEIEKPLSRWQKFKLDAGGFLLTVVGVGLLGLIAWLVLRLRRIV